MAPSLRNLEPFAARPARSGRPPVLQWPVIAMGNDAAADQRFILLKVVKGLELSAIAKEMHISLSRARTWWSRLRPWVLARLLHAVRADLAEVDWLLLSRVMGARMTPEEAAESVGFPPREAVARVLSLAHGPVEDLCGPEAANWLERAARRLPCEA